MAEPLSECLDILGELNSLLFGSTSQGQPGRESIPQLCCLLAASAAQSSAVAKSLQPLREDIS